MTEEKLSKVIKQIQDYYSKESKLPQYRFAKKQKWINSHDLKKVKWAKLVELAGFEAPLAGKQPQEVSTRLVDDDAIIDLAETINRKRRYEPKILFLDIETAPIEARIWSRFDLSVGINQMTRDWFILSFAAKFRGEDTIYYLDQRYSEPIEDESMILVAIHDLMSKADIIVAHNGKKFDFKRLRARFAKFKMAPMGIKRYMDTMIMAKKEFHLTSYALEFVAAFFGIQGKFKSRKFIGQELWNACLDKVKEAWEEMELYNKQDVVVLEEVFEALLPYDRTLNLTPYLEENTCTCGSTEFKRHDYFVAQVSKIVIYKCVSCQKEFKGRDNVLDKDQRKYFLKL
jgi:uncharacterized protein YprB with RNaseH-like and TPR domain